MWIKTTENRMLNADHIVEIRCDDFNGATKIVARMVDATEIPIAILSLEQSEGNIKERASTVILSKLRDVGVIAASDIIDVLTSKPSYPASPSPSKVSDYKPR